MSKITFSRNCISGLVADCRCKRCLIKNGEQPTEATELKAEKRAEIENEKFRQRTWEFLDKVSLPKDTEEVV